METLYQKMLNFLANEIVLSMKIHNIHWFMQGTQFFPMHATMDGYYEASQVRIDQVAEQLLMIGGKPLGTLLEALELSTIEERKPYWITAPEGVSCLIPDFDIQFSLAHDIVTLAESLEDVSTADIFTSFLNDINKTLWMFNAYIK